ncbi:MAG: hypothetical protein ACAI34_20740 [Verrucomicrobium sp.]
MLPARIGDEYYCRWMLPLVRGWAYIHGQRVKEGEVLIWQEETRRREDEWEKGLREKLRARKPLIYTDADFVGDARLEDTRRKT